jgi:nucleotide-binding universal stress UspA family protein
MFKTILVAVDGSDPSSRAVEAACSLASKTGASLYLIHVPELQITAVASGAGVVEIPVSRKEIEAEGRKIIDRATKLVEKCHQSVAGSKVAEGDPAHAILDYSEKIKADLIVAGRRGLGRFAGLLMGSVSQKIGQLADCAVMTVK